MPQHPKEEIDAYWRGYLQALYDYAWWKDGVMYIGSGIRTYKEAKAAAEANWKKMLEKEGTDA